MNWRVALLLPLFAGIAVGVMVAVVLLGRDDGGRSRHSRAAAIAARVNPGGMRDDY